MKVSILFLFLFLLFTLVPLAELWLLIKIGQMTSTLFTISLVVITGVIGAALAKHQGLENWKKLQSGMSKGQPPADALIDGLLILVAGAVLITPGILTDFFGFALLIPPIRSRIKKALKEAAKRRTVVHFQNMSGFQGGNFSQDPADYQATHQAKEDNVIDVDFTSETIED